MRLPLIASLATVFALAPLAAAQADVATEQVVVLEVTEPCRMNMPSGEPVETRVKNIVRTGYVGVIEVRLPAGDFTCGANPGQDDEIFLDDDKFYMGNPVYTWKTLTGQARVRIAPAGVALPAEQSSRDGDCTARTRISGWNHFLDRRSLGPWLAVSPAITEDTTMRLDIRCITVSNYVHSGIMIDPRTPGGDDDRLTLSGVALVDLMLTDIGTKGFTTDARRVELPADLLTKDGRRACSNGFAGIFLKQVTRSLVADSTFSNILNRTVPGDIDSEIECTQTAHGLYLRHDAKRNLLVNNLFTGISGAAIDLAVRSDENRIESSIFNQTGYAGTLNGNDVSAAWVLTWWDRKNGKPSDAPVGNLLVNPSGDRRPYFKGDDTAFVPQVACTLSKGGDFSRGEGDECTDSIKVVQVLPTPSGN